MPDSQSAEQELLARLTPGVERPGELRTAEGARVQQAAVLAGEGYALGRDAVGPAGAVVVGEALDPVPQLAQQAAAAAPARPVPMTMTVYVRRLAGLTSRISNLRWSHLRSMGPGGILASRPAVGADTPTGSAHMPRLPT